MDDHEFVERAPLDALSFEGFLSTRSPRLMATAQPAEEDTAPKASVDGEPLDDKQKAAILKEVAEGKAAARAQAQKIIASKKSASLGIKIGKAKAGEGVWLLMMYAPWCAHFKKMTPVFEQVAEHYHRQSDAVRVGRVDATAHPGLVAPFDIKGYPTWKIDGEYYAGEKDLDELEKLLAELRKSSSRFEVRLLMLSLVSRLVGSHRLMLPGFYPYAMRYLQPHQKEVTSVLASCVQAARAADARR